MSIYVHKGANRHVRVRQQRKPVDFVDVIRELSDEVYPDTNNIASLYEAFEPREAWRLAEKLEI